MNKDQIKGAAKDVAGKTQREAGRLTDNGTQEAKGATKQAAGKVQKTYGDAKEAVRNTTRRNSH